MVVQAVVSRHILITSSFKSVGLWSFSVSVLWRMWLLGVAASVKYACLMVLSHMTVSGLLLWTFRSIIMDLLEYSLWPQIVGFPCDRPHLIANSSWEMLATWLWPWFNRLELEHYMHCLYVQWFLIPLGILYVYR